MNHLSPSITEPKDHDRNLSSSLKPAQKCGGVKPVNGISTPFDNRISDGQTQFLSLFKFIIY
jgi:hypothetical protein